MFALTLQIHLKNHLKKKLNKNIYFRKIQTTKPTEETFFDLIVIGSEGPASQKCAINAAKKNKRVALIDKDSMIGGVCTHTGTIPSKTFREAVIHLTSHRHQGFYGKSYKVGQISLGEILHRVCFVETAEADIIKSQLKRNGIKTFNGMAKFINPHTIQVKSEETVDVNNIKELSAHFFLIATGTYPARRSDLNFDGKICFDSDQILKKDWKIPRDLIVVGSGVIGMEYASMLSIIPGSRVTVIDEKETILPFADREIVDSLCHVMRQQSTRFLTGEKINSLNYYKNNKGDDRISVLLDSGKTVNGDALLYTVGRQGNTEKLGLENVGIVPTSRGIISVNRYFQTNVPHIYAAGDCIGFPALASTSMEQGRLASCHMFDKESFPIDYQGLKRFPYGIYTIPEISFVGDTEQRLTANKVNYEVGLARYLELAKGQMLGGSYGLLKLLFHSETRELLGVHCIGEGATETIHIGQTVMDMKAPIEYFRDSVFNYPTMAEAYRVAAINGLQKIKEKSL